MSDERLILASASPRRRELLARIHPLFVVDPCPYPEPERKSQKVTPRVWAEALAYFKARAIAQDNPECWVLGADTIVACDEHFLGKPRGREDARRMLELQARRESHVITGVCLVRGGPPRQRLPGSDVTRVWMRDNSELREEYLATGDWEGKAGAYGIQNVGDRLVERYEGSFSNVMGLPLELVGALLSAAGLPVDGTAGGYVDGAAAG